MKRAIRKVIPILYDLNIQDIY